MYFFFGCGIIIQFIYIFLALMYVKIKGKCGKGSKMDGDVCDWNENL